MHFPESKPEGSLGAWGEVQKEIQGRNPKGGRKTTPHQKTALSPSPHPIADPCSPARARPSADSCGIPPEALASGPLARADGETLIWARARARPAAGDRGVSARCHPQNHFCP